jgi:D-tyrosyl-tRNA(Tyr) deacylase
MKLVIQRVSEASVTVNGGEVARIGHGLLVLLGVGQEDNEEHASQLAQKLSRLRLFADAAGKMNLSILDAGGEVLVVSQFTLYGNCRKGNRPSFDEAAGPEKAMQLYECFTAQLRMNGLSVQTGIFRANMKVALVNDGPVTILLETDSTFI